MGVVSLVYCLHCGYCGHGCCSTVIDNKTPPGKRPPGHNPLPFVAAKVPHVGRLRVRTPPREGIRSGVRVSTNFQTIFSGVQSYGSIKEDYDLRPTGVDSDSVTSATLNSLHVKSNQIQHSFIKKRWQNAPWTLGTINMHDEMINYKKLKHIVNTLSVSTSPCIADVINLCNHQSHWSSLCQWHPYQKVAPKTGTRRPVYRFLECLTCNFVPNSSGTSFVFGTKKTMLYFRAGLWYRFSGTGYRSRFLVRVSLALDWQTKGDKFYLSSVNPLIAKLKPQSNGPSCSNTVIGTLAVDGPAVTFGTARRGLGGVAARPGFSSLYQM